MPLLRDASSILGPAQEIAELLLRVVGDERQKALRSVALAWVPFADVEVVYGDTAITPRGSGTRASRSLVVGGTALVKAGKLTQYQAGQLLAGKTRGFLLGPYKVLKPIGQGGMGVVFLAEHTTLDHSSPAPGRTVTRCVPSPAASTS